MDSNIFNDKLRFLLIKRAFIVYVGLVLVV